MWQHTLDKLMSCESHFEDPEVDLFNFNNLACYDLLLLLLTFVAIHLLKRAIKSLQIWERSVRELFQLKAARLNSVLFLISASVTF